MSKNCAISGAYYDELEEMNLKPRPAQEPLAAHKFKEERIKYLTDEKRIKAVRSVSATWKAGCTCWIRQEIF